MTTIFISHSHFDRDAALALADALRATAINVWLDEEQVIAGQDFRSAMIDAATKADAVVTLLSKRSKQSAWLSPEVASAIAQGKRVIPLLLDEVVDVPFVLSDRAWLVLSELDGYEEAAQKIALATKLHSDREQDLRSRAESVSLQRAAMERERELLWHIYKRRESELRARSFTILFVLICSSGAGLLYFLDWAGSGSNFLWLAIGILGGAATAQVFGFLRSRTRSVALEEEVKDDAS